MDNEQSDIQLKDLPAQTENIAFNAGDMIGCAACERSNPPNRLNCLYCGAALEISDAQIGNIKPNLRRLEFWEKGYNLIVAPKLPMPDETKVREISKLTKLEPDALRKIFEADKSLPLVRAESEKEAEITKRCLSDLGIETTILSDETLAVEKPPQRLRGIEFFDDKLVLILFNQDEIVEIGNEDLVLIVTGATFERKIEAVEKYSKKGENKILDTTEVATDEILMDIYCRADAVGYRIWAKGFDFSCLETEKGILAKDNLKKLADKLRRIAPNVEYVDDYLRNRQALGDIWGVEQKSASQGLKRESFGKFNLGSVTTVNNLSQFTRYSRLQRHLL